MPRGGAPVLGLCVQDIVLERGEFGPQWILLPEEGVDWDAKAKAEEEAYRSGKKDRRESNAASDQKIPQSVSSEEESELGAKDDAGDCEEDQGQAVAFAGTGRMRFAARKEVTEGNCS